MTLELEPPLPRYIRELAYLLVCGMPSVTELKHDIRVSVLPVTRLSNAEDLNCCWGLFFWSEVMIHVAGLREPDWTQEEHEANFADTLAHEVGHYEQFRDGPPKQYSHHGATKRGRRMLRQLGLLA